MLHDHAVDCNRKHSPFELHSERAHLYPHCRYSEEYSLLRRDFVAQSGTHSVDDSFSYSFPQRPHSARKLKLLGFGLHQHSVLIQQTSVSQETVVTPQSSGASAFR